MINEKQGVLKPTPDDWYPTLPDGMVRVWLINFRGLNRVLVKGGDDYGLERDFPNPEDANQCYLWVMGQSIVTQRALIDRGFVPA